MMERRGAIRYQDGNIAGKEQKRSIATELEKREHDAWTRVLGTEVEVKPLPEYVTPEVIKNLEKLGMGLRFIPNLNLGTLDKLKKVGEEEFLKRLEERYPNWRRYEGLDNRTEKGNHSINRNLQQWYWKQVKNKRIDFPQLEGYWVAIETIPKPPFFEKYKDSPVIDLLGVPDRLDVSPNDVVKAIKAKKSELLTQAGLPASSDVKLPEAIEWNLLANREEWGKTNTYESTNTKYRQRGASGNLYVGSIGRGGAAFVYWGLSGGSTHLKGFRLMVVLSP